MANKTKELPAEYLRDQWQQLNQYSPQPTAKETGYNYPDKTPIKVGDIIFLPGYEYLKKRRFWYYIRR